MCARYRLLCATYKFDVVDIAILYTVHLAALDFTFLMPLFPFLHTVAVVVCDDG